MTVSSPSSGRRDRVECRCVRGGSKRIGTISSARCARPSPFLLHAWLSEWWRHYGDGWTLAVHVVRENGRLLGALPLMVGVKSGVRVVRFMGGRQSALGDLLLAPDADDSVAGLLAGQLAASDHHLVDLYGIPAGSRIVAALGPSRLHVIARIEAPVLDLLPSWAAVYEARASAKTRSLHRRRRRQLAALGRLEVSVARTPCRTGGCARGCLPAPRAPLGGQAGRVRLRDADGHAVSPGRASTGWRSWTSRAS